MWQLSSHQNAPNTQFDSSEESPEIRNVPLNELVRFLQERLEGLLSRFVRRQPVAWCCFWLLLLRRNSRSNFNNWRRTCRSLLDETCGCLRRHCRRANLLRRQSQ